MANRAVNPAGLNMLRGIHNLNEISGCSGPNSPQNSRQAFSLDDGRNRSQRALSRSDANKTYPQHGKRQKADHFGCDCNFAEGENFAPDFYLAHPRQEYYDSTFYDNPSSYYQDSSSARAGSTPRSANGTHVTINITPGTVATINIGEDSSVNCEKSSFNPPLCSTPKDSQFSQYQTANSSSQYQTAQSSLGRSLRCPFSKDPSLQSSFPPAAGQCPMTPPPPQCSSKSSSHPQQLTRGASPKTSCALSHNVTTLGAVPKSCSHPQDLSDLSIPQVRKGSGSPRTTSGSCPKTPRCGRR